MAAMILALLAVRGTQAQVGYGAAAGLSLPQGDFGKAAESGYQVTGLVNVSAPLAPIGFRGEGAFGEYNYKGTGNAKARVMSVTANAIVSPPGMMGLYAVGGVGLYFMSAQCSGCTSS